MVLALCGCCLFHLLGSFFCLVWAVSSSMTYIVRQTVSGLIAETAEAKAVGITILTVWLFFIGQEYPVVID